ncbi:MAG: carbohydrate ABC transporter permease, partial [Firmicutes bacterium]|nr:carbohydrate ABC transporter permease [Bacillota bacterium]
EIFTGMHIIPKAPVFTGYQNAFKSYGGDIDLLKSMVNTYKIIIPKVVFTILSSVLTAYGFGRFQFKGKRVLFAILMSTLFLPQVVLNVPQFKMYIGLGWVDSPWYLPIVLPALFASETYFVFLLIQFMRSIPKEMDEAATIDGCNSMQTLLKVIAPMLRPAIISVALFQFMWSNNDFMGPLLYVNTPARYPATIYVKLSMDADNGFEWNRVLAISLISIVPSLVVFFLAQNQFVEGISAGSVKG